MRIILLIVSLIAQAAPSASDHKACTWLNQVYSQCKTKLRFDGKIFRFRENQMDRSVLCSDERELDFYDRLENMDMRSVLAIPYQAGKTPLPELRRNFDPGRLRSEPLLKASFGWNESEVRAQLVPTKFLGQTIKFQKNLGAAASLERAGEQLLKESESDPELKTFLQPFTSAQINLKEYAFLWRNVSGTTRLSTHSFGTAIDLLLDEGPQYWLWDEKKNNPEKAKLGEIAYRNDHYIPRAAPIFNWKAVEIMERNGFIWGGKWNHYDTMHFEYRPEFSASLQADCDKFASMIFEPAANEFRLDEIGSAPGFWHDH